MYVQDTTPVSEGRISTSDEKAVHEREEEIADAVRIATGDEENARVRVSRWSPGENVWTEIERTLDEDSYAAAFEPIMIPGRESGGRVTAAATGADRPSRQRRFSLPSAAAAAAVTADFTGLRRTKQISQPLLYGASLWDEQDRREAETGVDFFAGHGEHVEKERKMRYDTAMGYGATRVKPASLHPNEPERLGGRVRKMSTLPPIPYDRPATDHSDTRRDRSNSFWGSRRGGDDGSVGGGKAKDDEEKEGGEREEEKSNEQREEEEREEEEKERERTEDKDKAGSGTYNDDDWS
jgi:hypothetical protein